MSIFERVNRAALPILPSILDRWLPGGKRQGSEYIVKNPTRADARLGSFSINMRTGKWADFATGDRGCDVISLGAYLTGESQYVTAKALAEMLGVRR